MLLNRDRALQVMERHGLDALVANIPENVMYLTDCDGHFNQLAIHGHAEQFAILPAKEDLPATFVCSWPVLGYLVDRPTWMPDVRMWGEMGRSIPPLDTLQGSARVFGEILTSARARQLPGPAIAGLLAALRDLGLERARLAVDSFELRAELEAHGLGPDVVTDGYQVFREVRAVKTSEEVELLRRASDANEAGFKALLGELRPGVSWAELKLAYDLEVVRHGALPGFWGAGSGPDAWRFNLFAPGSAAMERTVSEGDVIKLDIGCTYRHYWADTNRSAVVRGKAPEWFHRVSKALRAAREAYCEFLRPGARMGDAIQAYERVMWDHGLEEFRGAWGHALGLDCYDYPAPRIQRDTDVLFEADMVVNMEGGPAIIGVGAHSLENTYRITRSGFERWSSDEGLIVEV